MKEGGASASMRFGNLDSHDAKVKQAREQIRPDLCVRVHLTDERTYFAIREFVDAVAEQHFVLAELRQGNREAVSLLHASKG
jgi:hypothetical protein